MDVKLIPLDQIHPYEKNPRKNDEAIDKVAASIKEFGFRQPIVVDADHVIIAGHTRLEASKRIGLTDVPVVVADDLSEEQVRAYRLADNKTAEFSGWDFDLLNSELFEINDIDMAAFGFDMNAFTDGLVEAEDDDFDPDVADERAEPRVQRGQIWVLGEHRLMCGDSSSEADQASLLGGVQPKLVFTDPPYGVAIGDKNKMLDQFSKAGRVTKNIENDTLGTEELYDLLLKAFTALRKNCAEDCSYYVTSPQNGEIGLMMMMMMRDAGLEVRHNLIWEKSSATFSMGLDYDYKHEPIFYTWTKKHHFYGNGDCKNTVWQFPKPRKCNLHPTMKPVELVAECLKNSSAPQDPVCDIFGGSGTTLIACEQLNRKCFMMELDPHYCDVIIDRWEEYTGRKARLLDGKEGNVEAEDQSSL